jgi:hypothetical protein
MISLQAADRRYLRLLSPGGLAAGKYAVVPFGE